MSNKLKSTKTIDQIFTSGSKSFGFPIKILYIISPLMEGDRPMIQYTVSAPKKLFKKAVDRNRLKRQMRASVDITLDALKPTLNYSFSIVLIYIAKEMLDYKVIHNSVKKQLKNMLSSK